MQMSGENSGGIVSDGAGQKMSLGPYLNVMITSKGLPHAFSRVETTNNEQPGWISRSITAM